MRRESWPTCGNEQMTVRLSLVKAGNAIDEPNKDRVGNIFPTLSVRFGPSLMSVTSSRKHKSVAASPREVAATSND